MKIHRPAAEPRRRGVFRATLGASKALRRLGLAALCLAAVLVPLGQPARAGSGANFVTYNHHTADQGEVEIKAYSDLSEGAGSEYFAQLVELEYGLTDRWTTALYFEGVESDGTDYAFGGWRFENRLRLFAYDAVPFNPVLYVEYEELKPAHRYIRAVTGRTDEHEEEEEEEGTEREIESKLILGQDLTDRLDVAFNWINEVNVDNGNWEFGYALGLNYVLFEDESRHGGRSWDLKELKLGLELFGGLGDAQEGLTLDPDKTRQYAGLNLKGELANGMEIGIGGAFGLTGDSEDAILRLMLGYEFD